MNRENWWRLETALNNIIIIIIKSIDFCLSCNENWKTHAISTFTFIVPKRDSLLNFYPTVWKLSFCFVGPDWLFVFLFFFCPTRALENVFLFCRLDPARWKNHSSLPARPVGKTISYLPGTGHSRNRADL